MTEPASLPPRQSFATACGEISARLCGTGAPVLLLHGIGGNSGSWVEQFDAFAKSSRIIAWDAPGYGDSPPLPEPAPSTLRYAEAAVALLDALQIPQAAVVGHSLGGLMAASIAAHFPGRVSRIVLADCAAGHRSLSAAEREDKLHGRLAPLETMSPGDYARSRAPGLLSQMAPIELQAKAAAILAQIRLPGYRQAALMLSDADIFPDLARIRVPARVICGTDDRVTPEAANRKIAAALLGAGYVSISGAGHASYLEQPAAFNKAVLDFLKAEKAR